MNLPRTSNTILISISAAVAAGLVAAINDTPNCTTALAAGRDAILHEFADAGLNIHGEPVNDDATDRIAGYGGGVAAERYGSPVDNTKDGSAKGSSAGGGSPPPFVPAPTDLHPLDAITGADPDLLADADLDDAPDLLAGAPTGTVTE